MVPVEYKYKETVIQKSFSTLRPWGANVLHVYVCISIYTYIYIDR